MLLCSSHKLYLHNFDSSCSTRGFVCPHEVPTLPSGTSGNNLRAQCLKFHNPLAFKWQPNLPIYVYLMHYLDKLCRTPQLNIRLTYTWGVHCLASVQIQNCKPERLSSLVMIPCPIPPVRGHKPGQYKILELTHIVQLLSSWCGVQHITPAIVFSLLCCALHATHRVTHRQLSSHILLEFNVHPRAPCFPPC